MVKDQVVCGAGHHRNQPGMYAEHWAVVATQMDASLQKCFETAVNTKSKIKNFLRKYRPQLAMFSGDRAVEQILDSKEADFSDSAESVQVVIKSCKTGAAMFANVWLACSRKLYQKKLTDHLADLEREDYDPSRIDDWTRVTDDYSKGLRAEGHRRGSRQAWSATFDSVARR